MAIARWKHSMITVISVAAALLMSGVSKAGEWTGREIEREGVRHVLNPATAVEPAVTCTPAEIWQVGGGDEGEVLFGPINDVARNAAGVSFLLDSQLATVHVISPDGEYLRSIGREGEGPGEFRWASDIMLLADGTVCVLQSMPARAVMLTPEGKAAGDLPLPRGKDGSYAYLNGGSISKGELVLYLAEFIERETSIGLQTYFVRTDQQGAITATYWKLLQEQDLAKVTFDEKGDAPPVWAVAEDGRFFINNNWDAYEVEVVSADGTPVHVIEREYEPLLRDSRDIARTDSLKRKGEMPVENKVSETHRAVANLFPRGNGDMWVLSSRGERDIRAGIVGVFDVFDRRGRFMRQVTVHGPYVPGRDGFFLVGDFVYAVTNIGEFAGSETFSSAGENEANAGEISVTCLKLGKTN